MADAPSVHQKLRGKSRMTGMRWTLLVIGLFAVTIVIALNRGRIYRHLQDWRADRALAQAETLRATGEVQGALLVAAEALKTSPEHAPLIRFTADLLVKDLRDYATSITLLRRLTATGAATAEDLLLLAEAHIKRADSTSARETLNRLPETVRNQRRGLEVQSAIAALSGDSSEAERLLRKGLMMEPDNPDCRLRLAILDEKQAFDSARPSITARIWDMARGSSEASLAAIVHLAGSITTAPREAAELFELVSRHPKATDSERYLVLTACHRLNPEGTPRRVQDELARQRNRSPKDLGEFFQWLGTVGHHDKILELMPREVALKESRSLLIYIDALAAGSQWQALIELMQEPRLPISPPTRSLVLGQSYGHMKESHHQQAAEHLQDAMLTAGPNDQEILVRVASSADQFGMTGLAAEACQKLLVLRPEQRTQLLEKLVELRQRERDTAGMLSALKQLLQARPGNDHDAELLQYLRLLSGTEVELAQAWLHSASASSASAKRGTLPLLSALAAHRMGDHEAWQASSAAIREPEKLPPGMRGVVAGFLAMRGEKAASFRLMETLTSSVQDGRLIGDKRGLLLPEEQSLMEGVPR